MSVRLLPLFPLPLVLFPGAPLPLHIFEPRYRRLLADCLDGDRSFGILFRPEGVGERELAVGHVGCVALIESDESLPDGRSNIVVRGQGRFALDRFVASPAPYHVGEVEDYEDVGEAAQALEPAAERVRSTFARIGRAARALADDRDPIPPLPADPAALSFAIAALIDLDQPGRQRLLVSRSAAERLREIESILAAVVDALEARATVHARARTNGHGPHAEP